MPAGGFKTFVAGEILTAADTNDFLMQGILVFADATARDAAITSPVEGQFAYLSDDNELTFYDGVAWDVYSALIPAEVSATTGSPVTATSGGFDYYAFTGDGSITFSKAGVIDCVIIGAGGGGGGGSTDVSGGGGGAGDNREIGTFYVAEQTYTVTIGSGGAGGSATLTPGGTSAFGFSSVDETHVVAVGGGGGGDSNNAAVYSGGAGASGGGGAARTTVVSGNGLTGFNGGDRLALEGGGGGGGAGGVGGNASAAGAGTGGAGGAGTTVSATWLAAINSAMPADWQTATSSGTIISGGGGGGGSGTGGAAGSGGGGAGTTGATVGGNGAANTGGGGGGAERTPGGNGGSGFVIVRVAV